MQVMLMRLMSRGEYLIVPKGTKFPGSVKLGLRVDKSLITTDPGHVHKNDSCMLCI